jgi:Kef-type K+ transport system membrane component KefB
LQVSRLLRRIGPAFLLLPAGLEVQFDMLRGAVLRMAAFGFAISFGVAITCCALTLLREPSTGRLDAQTEPLG